MGKIIKRKVKKTFPWFLSLCLLGSLVLGFSFNINLDLVADNGIGLLSMSQEAQADTATTTVEVADAAPYFAAGDEPEEDPASASTSPVNIGDSIDFKGTGTDPEGIGFSLVVCTADSVSVSDWVPSCDGGGTELCSTASTTSGTEASCTYNNVQDPGSEQQVWYGFVCDKNRCSDSHQGGSTASGSPVYINHHPSLASVNTTVDDQEPGGTFTIQGSVTDSDTSGGADELEMHICTTAAFSSFTCDATTICSGTSTSPNVSCDYTDTSPTPDDDYTYYAFVFDWHDLEATSSASSTYTIINVSPEIGDGTVSLNAGQNINLNIKNASEVEVAATTTSVTDQNGCTDLSSATSTMYLSGEGAACPANDNNCYIVSSCTLSDCSGASDSTATYTCTTTFAYHTVPTDAGVGGGYAAQSWYARITVTDDDGAATSSSYTTLDGVEVVSAAALDVSEILIDYGVVDSNSNTDTWNASTTVVNYGNTPLDNELYGLDLEDGANLVGGENQKFSTSTFDYDTGGTSLTASSSPGLDLNVEIARPTSQSDVSDVIWWGISIPLGTVSGEYYGQNTFSASEDADGNWN